MSSDTRSLRNVEHSRQNVSFFKLYVVTAYFCMRNAVIIYLYVNLQSKIM